MIKEKISTALGQLTISSTLDRRLRAIAKALVSEPQRIIGEEVGKIAEQARASWYGPDGVTRRTGASGDIQTKVLVSETEIRGRLYTTDERRDAKSKRPLAVLVHTPRLMAERVDHKTWWEAQASGDPVRAYPYLPVPSTHPQAGKTLWARFARQPLKAQSLAIAQRAISAVADLAKRGP